MAEIAKNLNAAFLSVSKTVKTSSGSAVNIAICLVTVGSEQLFSFAVFRCPCPDKNKTGFGGTTISPNTLYGTVYIIVPAIALFFLGYAMNIRTWKLMTGCWKRHDRAARGYVAGCNTLLEIFFQALVAPCAWVAVAMLDGKYFACAMAPQPYDMSCSEVVRTETAKIRYTVQYERQRQRSQIWGWLFIALVLFLGSLMYMLYRWCSPLTYHHRNFMKWYQEIEIEEFENISKEEIREETKENVKNFLHHKREKEHWDKIATVFTHTRDKTGIALYSRLDQWNELHYPPKCVEDPESSDSDESESKAINRESPPSSSPGDDTQPPPVEAGDHHSAEDNAVTTDDETPEGAEYANENYGRKEPQEYDAMLAKPTAPDSSSNTFNTFPLVKLKKKSKGSQRAPLLSKMASSEC